MGDYRQLADALFHAGTRSGSQFEHVDTANRLHLYVVAKHRDAAGVLSYTVAARSLDSSGGGSVAGVALSPGSVAGKSAQKPGVSCVFTLKNTGLAAPGADPGVFGSDVFRLNATVAAGADGWRVVVPNALAAVPFGGEAMVRVAVGAAEGAAEKATVELTATSEMDGRTRAVGQCVVERG